METPGKRHKRALLPSTPVGKSQPEPPPDLDDIDDGDDDDDFGPGGKSDSPASGAKRKVLIMNLQARI